MAQFDMPGASASFDVRGGWLVTRLVTDLGITDVEAAGIVGNLGGESGLQAINEKHPIVEGSRGGFGWEQATGVRRRALEADAVKNGLNVASDEENYNFLLLELRGSEAQALRGLKKTTTLDDAVRVFEVLFERPSDPAAGLPSRIAFARRALAAARAAKTATSATSTPAAADPIVTAMEGVQRALAAAGDYRGPIDADPGPGTRQAMHDYRVRRGV